MGLRCPFSAFAEHDDGEARDQQEPIDPVFVATPAPFAVKPPSQKARVERPVTELQERVEEQLEELTKDMDDRVVEDVEAGRSREPVGRLASDKGTETPKPRAPGKKEGPGPPDRQPKPRLTTSEQGATRAVVRVFESTNPPDQLPGPLGGPRAEPGRVPGPPLSTNPPDPQSLASRPPTAELAEKAEMAVTDELRDNAESFLEARRSRPKVLKTPKPPVTTKAPRPGRGGRTSGGRGGGGGFFFNASARIRGLLKGGRPTVN